eukprot:TRINITY_DN996_c0_g1_i5.p1 TRINITY_DN996_c0_g1~~TRINITY_DN996_c0_g1_i5.p1  ORF type:complete len:300 (+),score=66.55 TRINITY_DN996_c0_g1_i5:784-1683(+)
MLYLLGVAAAILISGASAASRSSSLAQAIAQSESTAYATLPGWDNADIGSPLNLAKFALENMAATFDDAQDTLPGGRPKLIHARGVLAPVTFSVTDPSFGTGLFQSGGDSCLARLSVAANPNSLSFTPGMAIKCYRDNQASGNIISMYSLDGQADNWDFFANEFTNLVPQPSSVALKAIALIFHRASSCPTHITLKQWANVTQTGQVVGSPVWPEQIWFVPAGPHFDPTKGHGDFRDDLTTIPVGTKIWDVYVSQNYGDADRYKIAEVKTTGKFIASSFSDSSLFFQHDRGEENNCDGP